jgi:hypothetical protein
MTTLQRVFESRALSHGHQDMIPHMHQLYQLAQMCRSVVEFGVRTGQSTIALAAGLESGGGGTLRSYDIMAASVDVPKSETVTWTFQRADTGKLPQIEPCDLLFIDTLHNSDQVEAELKHSQMVRKYIVLHDVYMFAHRGENGGGIIKPILEFLAANPQWQVGSYYHSEWGLLVLNRVA